LQDPDGFKFAISSPCGLNATLSRVKARRLRGKEKSQFAGVFATL
jgi:hypothetical protein